MTSRNKLKKQENAFLYPSGMKHKPYDRNKRLQFYTSSERSYEKDETRKEAKEAINNAGSENKE